MTADEAETPDMREGRGRGWRIGRPAAILLAFALLLVLALLVVWSQRKPLAADYVDKALAARGVQARYKIAKIGLGSQRLTDVVIGDPAHPDLVADWIEVGTSIGLSGVGVRSIRAGHVRMRASWVDGRLSLGAIDRLMPAPSGKPFTLPAIDADIADARIRLTAPQGVVGLKISGQGRLDGGFSGMVAAVSDRLLLGDCKVVDVSAAMAVRIVAAEPALQGPVRIASASCGANRLRDLGADLTISLNDRLDRVRGEAGLSVAAIESPAAKLEQLEGTIGFTGRPSDVRGSADLHSGAFDAGAVRGARLTLGGTYRVAGGTVVLGGPAPGMRLVVSNAAVTPARLAPVARLAGAGAGTPIGPLARAIARAAVAAGQSFDLDADVSGQIGADATGLSVWRLALRSASGARIGLSHGSELSMALAGGPPRIRGTLSIAGGGLPEATIRLAQAKPGAPVTGTATIAPYAAGDARIAVSPVRFSATPAGNTRIFTTITLSGPLGDGRVEALRLPVTAAWDGAGRLLVNPLCVPLSFDRVAVSGLALRPATIALCPVDGALFRLNQGRMGGGVRIATPRLMGSLGSTPIAVSADGAELRLAGSGFRLSRLGVRIGAPDRLTRLDFEALDGRLVGAAVQGGFSGATGHIANVPLLMSGAEGTWRLAGGRLAVDAAMTVADAAADPRFKPLAARHVALALVDGRITTTGTLFEPTKDVKVADVAIVHDLARGAGQADLTVPGIGFGKDFQPDELTRLTFGVIANVVGTVRGEGHIRWNAEGVTSDGVFSTAGTDLAAAFGPVTGLSTEIHFSDLLNLETPPGQVATVATINPGVPVHDGTIRFRLLRETRVQVEKGEWPLAGGSLVLEPTLLDFAENRERRMTFRIADMDAALFLQQFDFKNLNATGTFDGVLPMVFDEKGGRIENGRLTAHDGGGTIAYVGDLSQKDLGFWGNMAFQALKSLRYRNVDIAMNGPLAGEMVTEIHFAGVGQGVGAKRNFILDRLQKLPFIFNVRVKAPFRQLIDSAQSLYDPRRLIQRNLPALMEEQKKRTAPPAPAAPLTPAPTPIQPPASRTMP